MLSIIICSVNQHYLYNVKKNIADTIGIPYELLVHNNSTNPLGLCAVYNLLAEKASFPYLLFLHEDVLFTTNNWGQLLSSIFDNDTKIGLIGLAGSSYKSKKYSGWHTNIADYDAYNIIHDTNNVKSRLLNHRSIQLNLYPVVCLDGVFISARKELWQKVKFNDEKLKGFHFYDLDFSLRSSLLSNVVVTMEIELEHITTGGDFGDKWVEQAFIFHDYMKQLLPIYLPNCTDSELAIAKLWLDRLKINRISFSNKLQWVLKQKLYMHLSLYYGIIKFFIYQPLGLAGIHRIFKKLKQ